jgi:Fur family transcriptional regulator, peroxide stress response regulator
MFDREKVISEIKRSGIRLTPQRRAILDYLASTDLHPNAQQIFHEVQKAHPDISLATIYNTLKRLVELGLLKMLEVEPDNRYETNLAQHINLICDICGKIQDMDGGLSINSEEVLHRCGFQVRDSRLEYHGVCSNCRKGQ